MCSFDWILPLRDGVPFFRLGHAVRLNWLKADTGTGTLERRIVQLPLSHAGRKMLIQVTSRGIFRAGSQILLILSYSCVSILPFINFWRGSRTLHFKVISGQPKCNQSTYLVESVKYYRIS